MNFVNHPRSSTETLSGKTLDDFFILDSRATNHMIGRLDFLQNIIDIAPQSIGFPNGKHAWTSKAGTVYFGRFKLKNVPCFRDLQCNMISISELQVELPCIISFINHFLYNTGLVLEDLDWSV